MNDELERMWKEGVVACFVSPRHWPEESDGRSHDEPLSEEPLFGRDSNRTPTDYKLDMLISCTVTTSVTRLVCNYCSIDWLIK